MRSRRSRRSLRVSHIQTSVPQGTLNYVEKKHVADDHLKTNFPMAIYPVLLNYLHVTDKPTRRWQLADRLYTYKNDTWSFYNNKILG